MFNKLGITSEVLLKNEEGRISKIKAIDLFDKINYKVSYDGNEYSIEATYDYKIIEK